MKIPVIVVSAGSPQFWWRFGAYMLATNAIVGIWNIKLHRNIPGSESLSTVATYSLYKTAQSILTSISVIRLLLVYIPNYKPSPTISSPRITGIFDEEEILKKFRDTNSLKKTILNSSTVKSEDVKTALLADVDDREREVGTPDMPQSLPITRLRREHSTGNLSRHILQIQIHSALKATS